MQRHDATYVKRQIRDHWDARAPMLDVAPWHIAKGAAEHEAWLATLRQHLPPGNNQDVLDVGTGLGYLAGVAAQLGHHSWAIDIAPTMIKRATERALELGLAIDFRVANVDALPFDGQTFDAITERHVLWTMLDPSHTLAELRRVLRPGGYLLVFESLWLERPDAPVGTAMGGAPNLDEHYRDFRADLPLIGGRSWQNLVSFLGTEGFQSIVHDPLDEVYAERVAYDLTMSRAPERRMYLLRAMAAQ